MANNIGKITQIIGAVLDIKFTEGNLPEINDAIRIPLRGDQAGKELTVEVSQHLGDDQMYRNGINRWISPRHGCSCSRRTDQCAGR